MNHDKRGNLSGRADGKFILQSGKFQIAIIGEMKYIPQLFEGLVRNEDLFEIRMESVTVPRGGVVR
jgi:hypothetical protein